MSMGEETLLISARAENQPGYEPGFPREGIVFEYMKVVDKPEYDPTKPETYLEPQSAHDDAVEQMEEATAGTNWV